MTVRRRFAFVLALLALLLGAGCGGGDAAVVGPETEDPQYREGQQLRRRGRDSEALVAFLNVIEKRGDRESAESHFEAGLIYLQHVKDPEEAIHHFKRYLYLKPTSPQATGVRDLLNTARREFAKTLPARPPEEQAMRFEAMQELERLRRENTELQAELATLRGGGSAPVRNARPVNFGIDPRSRATSATAREAPSPLSAAPPRDQPAPFQPAPTTSAPPPVTRPAPTTRSAMPTGRTHTVAQSDSLWKIARRHYGDSVNAAKVRGIYEANRDQMRDEGDLKPGMTLKIP